MMTNDIKMVIHGKGHRVDDAPSTRPVHYSLAHHFETASKSNPKSYWLDVFSGLAD